MVGIMMPGKCRLCPHTLHRGLGTLYTITTGPRCTGHCGGALLRYGHDVLVATDGGSAGGDCSTMTMAQGHYYRNDTMIPLVSRHTIC
jgi:hypothetical protein